MGKNHWSQDDITAPKISGNRQVHWNVCHDAIVPQATHTQMKTQRLDLGYMGMDDHGWMEREN